MLWFSIQSRSAVCFIFLTAKHYYRTLLINCNVWSSIMLKSCFVRPFEIIKMNISMSVIQKDWKFGWECWDLPCFALLSPARVVLLQPRYLPLLLDTAGNDSPDCLWIHFGPVRLGFVRDLHSPVLAICGILGDLHRGFSPPIWPHLQ